jgi:hypothetical protein
VRHAWNAIVRHIEGASHFDLLERSAEFVDRRKTPRSPNDDRVGVTGFKLEIIREIVGIEICLLGAGS